MYLLISFFWVIFSLPIFWLLWKTIRYIRFTKFLKLWIDLLVINFIISILLISNPYQNFMLLYFVFGSLYFLFFYVYSKRSFGFEILRDLFNDKKIKKRIDRDKKYFVFLVTLYVTVMWIVFVIGSGDIMIELRKYNEISDKIMINNWWNILYDNNWIGAYNIWIYDEDNDSYYETIKYDLNRDWKADIIHIDTNWDFEIDEIIYKDYQEKRIPIIIIFLITCFIALVIIIKSWKTLKEVLKEVYKRKMEEEKINLSVVDWWEQINMSSIQKNYNQKENIKKEENTISFKDLIKKSFSWKKNVDSIEKDSNELDSQIKQEQENLNNLTDLLINWVIDNDTYASKGKEIKDRIENLKSKEKDNDKGKDLWKGLKSLIILSLFSISILLIILKDSVYALQITDISQIQSRHTKCVQDPYDDKNCIWVWLEYRKFFQHLQNPTFKKEFDLLIEKMQNANNNPTEKSQINKERNIRWSKWQKINPKDSIYSSAFKFNNLFKSINNNYSWNSNNTKFDNENISTIYKKITNSQKNQEIVNYLNYLDWLEKYEKQLITNSSDLLKNINILNQNNNISKSSNRQLIVNYLEKWTKDFSLKWDYLNYINLLNKIALVNNGYDFSKIDETLWLQENNQFQYRILLDKLWDSMNNFHDYQIYNLMPTYSNKKIIWMLTLTNFIEQNASSNPIDLSLTIASHLGNYFWYNKIQSTLWNYKIWKNYRHILLDSYTISNSNTAKATNYFYNQIVWETQEIQWGLKTNTTWKFVSIKNYIYWKNVLFFQKYSHKIENSLYLWIEWVRFISKWICWIIE